MDQTYGRVQPHRHAEFTSFFYDALNEYLDNPMPTEAQTMAVLMWVPVVVHILTERISLLEETVNDLVAQEETALRAIVQDEMARQRARQVQYREQTADPRNYVGVQP